MKKLALVLLLAAACRSNVQSSPQPSAGSSNAGAGVGASTPRGAVDAFLRSVKQEDLQAMGAVWGTKEGAARDLMPRADLERRELVMMRCFRHDSYQVKHDAQGAAGTRVLAVELVRPTERRTTNFTAVLGKDSRWFVLEAQVDPVREWCGTNR